MEPSRSKVSRGIKFDFVKEPKIPIIFDFRLNNQLRAGINGELHLTLDKILEKIKEALNTIKKEKNQFLEIKKIYRAYVIFTHTSIKLNLVAELPILSMIND